MESFEEIRDELLAHPEHIKSFMHETARGSHKRRLCNKYGSLDNVKKLRETVREILHEMQLILNCRQRGHDNRVAHLTSLRLPSDYESVRSWMRRYNGMHDLPSRSATSFQKVYAAKARITIGGKKVTEVPPGLRCGGFTRPVSKRLDSPLAVLATMRAEDQRDVLVKPVGNQWQAWSKKTKGTGRIFLK